MKNIIFIVLLFCTSVTDAQVKKVFIQASGLTCSMCSRAIYKALQSVDFVETVDAHIQNSTFELTFVHDADVDFDKLKNKVEDAGFFVTGFWATMHFDNLKIKNDSAVETTGKYLMFLDVADQELNGDKTVKIIDKGYVSAAEYKRKRALTTKECYKTGIDDATGTENGSARGSRIYHATI
jgi:copper chaperone CopZ